MERYSIEDVKRLLLGICGTCVENQEILTELDSRLGDGDMGISMGNGARAIRQAVAALPPEEKDLTKLFMSCAMGFNRAAPSTLGTLLSFGMMAVGRRVEHAKVIEEDGVAALLWEFTETIAAKGKAKPGDKTILDALYPLAETLKRSYEACGSLQAAFREACEAAREGMEKTKGIKAKTGRASWLDTRNMEYPDAGAVLCVLVSEGIGKLE